MTLLWEKEEEEETFISGSHFQTFKKFVSSSGLCEFDNLKSNQTQSFTCSVRIVLRYRYY